MPTAIIIGGFVIAALAIIGWIVTETLKVKHGYPVADSWGREVTPQDPAKLAGLEAENAALREQLDTVYDRLETLERIVTDKPSRLAAEIDSLKSLPPRPAKRDAAAPDAKEEG